MMEAIRNISGRIPAVTYFLGLPFAGALRPSSSTRRAPNRNLFERPTLLSTFIYFYLFLSIFIYFWHPLVTLDFSYSSISQFFSMFCSAIFAARLLVFVDFSIL